jgi:hypothetical protein
MYGKGVRKLFESFMARRRRQQRRQAHGHPFLMLATCLLSTAEDEDDHLSALVITQLALRQIRKEQTKSRYPGKYGPRGPYDRVKSGDFLCLLLDEFTDRQFKSWLR